MYELPDLSEAEVFPYPESSWMELKNAYTSCHFEKILQTICAFLNTTGGYMVFGVSDDRGITGVQLKGYDSFALKIDDIYHRGLITHDDGKHIEPHAVTVSLVKTGLDKHICVVRVVTDLSAKMYSIAKDNTVWYRLNASNYRCRTLSVVYTRKEFEKAVKAETKRLRESVATLVTDTRGYAKLAAEAEATSQALAEEYAREKCHSDAVIECLRKELEEARKKLETPSETETLRKALEANMKMHESLTSALHESIIKHKKEVEYRVEVSRLEPSVWSSLLCGVSLW
jgi:predicted HTH transcriptional regulator